MWFKDIWVVCVGNLVFIDRIVTVNVCADTVRFKRSAMRPSLANNFFLGKQRPQP